MTLTSDGALRLKHMNALTKALPEARWNTWRPHISMVSLNVGDVLSAPSQKIRFHYFPVTAVIALHCGLTDGYESEIALIGNEGVLGAWALSDKHSTPQRSSVQFSGLAIQIDAPIVVNEFETISSFRNLIVRYISSLLNYASQTSGCYRHHSLVQQVARTILIASKRLHSDHIPLTHDHLARILGVRREGITVATNKLKQLGLITQAYGTITVMQRASLRLASCECLAAFETIYDKLRS